MSAEEDDELPAHVEFRGLKPKLSPPLEGGLSRLARELGVSRRTVARWKQAGTIPFFSADRALARNGDHPISYWPEAYGLPREERQGAPGVDNVTSETAMGKPKGAFGSGATRVLLSVVRLDQSAENITVADVAGRAGLSKTTTWGHLKALRDEGLVSWIDGLAGTIRPTVACVRVDVKHDCAKVRR